MTNARRGSLLGAVALWALAAGGPAQAQAQAEAQAPAQTEAQAQAPAAADAPTQAPAPSGQTPPGAPAANPGDVVDQPAGLQDIVVTARKRGERLQDVPIAVTAFGGAQLAAQGITNIAEIAQLTPGLQFGTGSQARNQVFLRGIGTNRFDAFGEPSSATFVDEVYQPRFADQYMDLLNIERIEVLKGPQGTLFGRNTIGGAISVYTPTPGRAFEASGRLEATTYDQYAASAYVAGPLTGGVSASLAGGYRRGDGYMRDTVSGRTDGYENYAVRGKLLLEPVDRLKVTLTGTLIRNRQDAVLFDPGAGQPILLASPLLPTPAYSGDRYAHAYTDPGFINRRADSGIVRLDYAMPFATLTSISAYQYSRTSLYQDLDASALDAFNYAGIDHTKLFTQEVRLASEDGGGGSLGGRLQWVVGAFYLREKVDETIDIEFGRQSVVALLSGGTPVFNTIAKASTNESLAFFGQATFRFTDALGLTLGGRYTRDTKDFVFNGTTNRPGLPQVFAPFTQPGRGSWTSFDPKVTLDYRVAPDVLAYATFAKGFKGGTLQSNPFDAATAALLVAPEKVNSYELGLKSELLGRTLRLNVAAFYNDYTDQQVQRIVVLPSGLVTNAISNAASSTIKGLEAELTIAPSRSLQVNVAYAYLDAKFDSFIVDPVNNIDLSGNRMPRAPQHTVTIDGTYSLFMDNGSRFFAGGKLFWTDEYFFAAENQRVNREESYAVTDLRAGWTSSGERVSVTAWVKNLFDVEYRLYADSTPPRAVWSPKRTGGVTLSVRY